MNGAGVVEKNNSRSSQMNSEKILIIKGVGVYPNITYPHGLP